VESTWESRDLPVLDAIVSALDEDMMAIINVGDVADRLDIDAVDAFKACQALRGTYIQLDLVMAGGSPRPHHISDVTDAARRAVGQWPSADVWTERLLLALNAAADAEPDADRKKGLRVAAQTLGGIGRSVLVNVVTQGIEGTLPHHF